MPARLVLDLKPRDHVTPALRELHWLHIGQRIEYKLLCVLAHKTLIGHAPDYISDLLSAHTGHRHANTLVVARLNLFLPRTER